MACNSEYLNPTRREAELQRACKLYLHVVRWASVLPGVPKPEFLRRVKVGADDMYCSLDVIPTLCNAMESLSKKDLARVMGNIHDSTHRDLAEWWDQHQEADRKRKLEEAEAKARVKTRKEALAKLTPEEKKALGF